MKNRLALLILALGVVIYFSTFIWPAVPIYQGYNAPIFLTGAIRMSEGQVLYRDFFELTFPGAELFYLGLIKILGIHAWIPNAVLVVMGMGLAWLGVTISRRVLEGPLMVLPSIAFTAFVFVTDLDATHHWFSIVAVLAGLALLMKERTVERTAGTGLLFGVATCFTQTRGPLAFLALVIFLVWEFKRRMESRRWLLTRLGVATATFLAPVLPLVLYFIWKVGFRLFVSCTFLLPIHYYSSIARNNMSVYMADQPDFSGWLQVVALAIWLFIHLLVPLVYLIFLARYFRVAKHRPEEPWDQLMLISLIGLSLFASIAFSPNWFKISSSTLPAMILFVWFVKAPGRLNTALRSLLWSAAIASAVALPAIAQANCSGELSTPTGRAAFNDDQRYDKYRWLLNVVHPGETYFHAGDMETYFLLGLRNPTYAAVVTPDDWTRPERVESIIRSLSAKHVRYVLWSAWLDWPDPDKPQGDHLGPLRAYLCAHYRIAKTFTDGDELWERNVERDSPPPVPISRQVPMQK
jgi:hypothetical protein